MATDKEMIIPAGDIYKIFTYEPVKGGLYRRFDKEGTGVKKTTKSGCKAFTTKERKGYMNGRVNGILLKEHRCVWAWHYGEWPDDQIDHINGIPWDNRIENLRQSKNSDNCKNRNMNSSNTSGWTGVSFNKRSGKWSAKYKKNYVDIFVGNFNCPTVAHFAIYKHRSENGFEIDHGARGRDSITSL